ncbi:MAG: ROK family protein [Peptostreptococcaceae bacterium]
MKYVVFDIGGTNIKYSLMNESGEMLDSHITSTPEQGQGKTLNLLVEIIKSYQENEEIDGVAMSVPGGIDDDGYIHFMGSVFDLQNIYLNEHIKKETGLNCVYDNDVNCVAMAEKYKGNAINNKNFVCITIGTGIGGGIFINNQLYRGARGMAGEFGINILEHRKSELPNMEYRTFSRLGSTCNLVDRVNKLKNIKLSGEEVFELAQNGDKEILNEIENFYFDLAIGIYNIVYSLAPEKVLIGGGVSVRDDLIENVKSNLKLLNPEVLELVEIDVCKFQNDSGKIGALYKYLNNK